MAGRRRPHRYRFYVRVQAEDVFEKVCIVPTTQIMWPGIVQDTQPTIHEAMESSRAEYVTCGCLGEQRGLLFDLRKIKW